MMLPNIVTGDEWLVARKALLEREKEMTRARDRLDGERRMLPNEACQAEFSLARVSPA